MQSWQMVACSGICLAKDAHAVVLGFSVTAEQRQLHPAYHTCPLRPFSLLVRQSLEQ